LRGKWKNIFQPYGSSAGHRPTTGTVLHPPDTRFSILPGFTSKVGKLPSRLKAGDGESGFHDRRCGFFRDLIAMLSDAAFSGITRLGRAWDVMTIAWVR